MKIYLQILIVVLISSCNSSQPENKYTQIVKNDSVDSIVIANEESEQQIGDSLIQRDFFVDSTHVGNKGKNKLEARLFESKDSIYIRIEFFTIEQNNWKKKNQFEFEKDGISGIDPVITDFNNDSFKDFHYKATIAARGANDVRRLFIYDHSGDSLILIKNSLDYPNMVYNKKLDCIDAWLIHGCSSQAFLKIEKDSLIDFAWVQLSNRIHVYEVDKKGNENELLNDSTNQFGCYTRFISYNPLIEYESYPNE